MRTKLRGPICWLALGISHHSAAQESGLAELLLPVDVAIAARLTSPAYAGLRKDLYFAKQYRIVTIDSMLLEKEGATFTVSLFDGVSLKVTARQTETAASNAQVRHWRGEIRDVVPPSMTSAYESDPERKANLQQLSTLELRIRANSLTISPKLQKALAEDGDERPRISNAPPGASVTADGTSPAAKIAVTTVHGRWIVPALRAQVVLKVVEEDPRYHVVYIEDPAKQPVGPHAKERRQQFSQFIEQVDAEARQYEEANR